MTKNVLTLASAVAATASAALFVWASPAMAHGSANHEGTAASAKTPKAEQKPWGIAGDARKASRTVTIHMGDDMRFTPDRVEVREGETVRFVVANNGKMLHEMVIGTPRELDEHAALMAKFPDMEHDEPYMAHVPASGRRELVWNFNRPGEFSFACLVAGHYQAGMTGKIKVTAR